MLSFPLKLVLALNQKYLAHRKHHQFINSRRTFLQLFTFECSSHLKETKLIECKWLHVKTFNALIS